MSNITEILDRVLRDDNAIKTKRIGDLIGEMQAENAKLRAANASLTRMNDALAAGMQAAANRRYQQQRILDEDETLIAGLTILFDREQRKRIKAENDSKTLEPG